MLTDILHEICNFCSDYEFITKKSMKTIQKKIKVDNKILYFKTKQKYLASLVNTVVTRYYDLLNCQRWEYTTIPFYMQTFVRFIFYHFSSAQTVSIGISICLFPKNAKDPGSCPPGSLFMGFYEILHHKLLGSLTVE